MGYDIVVDILRGAALQENLRYEIPCESMVDYAFFEIEIHEMDDLLQSLDSKNDSGGPFTDQVISAITKVVDEYKDNSSTARINLVLAGQTDSRRDEESEEEDTEESSEYPDFEDWDLGVSVYVRPRE